MEDDTAPTVKSVAERVIELEEEVEASGYVTTEGAALEAARASLHKWVDRMTGVVVSPGLGRVTVLHGEGRPSTIASAELPYLISRAV